jgi:hypothetical protein
MIFAVSTSRLGIASEFQPRRRVGRKHQPEILADFIDL